MSCTAQTHGQQFVVYMIGTECTDEIGTSDPGLWLTACAVQGIVAMQRGPAHAMCFDTYEIARQVLRDFGQSVHWGDLEPNATRRRLYIHQLCVGYLVSVMLLNLGVPLPNRSLTDKIMMYGRSLDMARMGQDITDPRAVMLLRFDAVGQTTMYEMWKIFTSRSSFDEVCEICTSSLSPQTHRCLASDYARVLLTLVRWPGSTFAANNFGILPRRLAQKSTQHQGSEPQEKRWRA